MENVFDIDKFNIIEDEENYYFFRALNMADNQDLEAGVTLDNAGNIEKIKELEKESFEQASTLVSKQGLEKKIHGPVSLVEAIIAAGKKGITINRYKGLGEMNPEQLWETTLDPEARSLLQVKINQMEEADETFATLMGDVVEPRKEFIQDNALNVVNLDI